MESGDLRGVTAANGTLGRPSNDNKEEAGLTILKAQAEKTIPRKYPDSLQWLCGLKAESPKWKKQSNAPRNSGFVSKSNAEIRHENFSQTKERPADPSLIDAKLPEGRLWRLSRTGWPRKCRKMGITERKIGIVFSVPPREGDCESGRFAAVHMSFKRPHSVLAQNAFRVRLTRTVANPPTYLLPYSLTYLLSWTRYLNSLRLLHM